MSGWIGHSIQRRFDAIGRKTLAQEIAEHLLPAHVGILLPHTFPAPGHGLCQRIAVLNLGNGLQTETDAGLRNLLGLQCLLDLLQPPAFLSELAYCEMFGKACLIEEAFADEL